MATRSTCHFASVAFSSLLVLASWLGPRATQAEDRVRDTIDRRVADAWTANKLAPAPKSSDSEFLRRVYLDLLGVIPSREEAVEFINDSDADKRAKLIDRLLQHPRFGLHQADVWDMVYFGRNPPGFGTRDRDGFKNWLQSRLQENTPYNVWARAILRAEGNTVEQGPPMFYVQYKNAPEDAIQAITQRFLGVQLQCARCHDHPFDDWTQLDFYGMAAFVARLQVVDVGKKGKLKAYAIGEKNLGDVLFSGPAAQQAPGQKGDPVKPKFLGGESLSEAELPKDFKEVRNFPSGKMPPKPKASRKDALANWITDKDNPFFAKAAVNRVWAQYMGRGLVHPVDNLSPQNEASHPELFNELSSAFVAHNFDLKWLTTEILNSKAYQLSSRGSNSEAQPNWYERARYRPLSAEELFESWMLASGFDKVMKADGKKPDSRFRVRGITWDYLVRAFGQPNDGVGDFQGGMHEHLYLNNGQVRQMISNRPGGLLDEISKSKESWEQRVETLFLQVLSRRPSEAETKKFADFLSAKDDPSGRLHDAIWTLMTCTEFRFNH